MPNTKEPEENSKNIVSLTTSPEFMFLLQRIDRVEEKLSAKIDQETSNLKQNIDKLRQDTGSLKQDIGNLKQDISGVKQDVGNLKQDISGVKQDVGNLKQDISGIKQDISSLKQDNHALRGLIWGTFGLLLTAMGIAVTVAITILR